MYSTTLESIGQEVPELPQGLDELEREVKNLREKCLNSLGEEGLRILSFLKGEGDFPDQISKKGLKATLEILRPLFLKFLVKTARVGTPFPSPVSFGQPQTFLSTLTSANRRTPPIISLFYPSPVCLAITLKPEQFFTLQTFKKAFGFLLQQTVFDNFRHVPAPQTRSLTASIFCPMSAKPSYTSRPMLLAAAFKLSKS